MKKRLVSLLLTILIICSATPLLSFPSLATTYNYVFTNDGRYMFKNNTLQKSNITISAEHTSAMRSSISGEGGMFPVQFRIDKGKINTCWYNTNSKSYLYNSNDTRDGDKNWKNYSSNSNPSPSSYTVYDSSKTWQNWSGNQGRTNISGPDNSACNSSNWMNAYIHYFESNGNSKLGTSAQIDDDTTTTISSYSKTGYNFQGWATSPNSSTVAVTAGTSVTFNFDNSTIRSTWAPRFGYILDNTYKRAVFGTASYSTFNYNNFGIALFAVWSAKTCTVTLNNQSATTAGTTSVTGTYGSNLPSITKPTKTGYTFGGYYTGTGGGGTQYINANGAGSRAWDKESNTTLYAYWIPETYTVSYNSNGGSGTIASQTKSYGVNLTLSNGSGFTGPNTTITYSYTNGGAGSTSTSKNRAIAGWNLNSASGTAYALSGTYSTNATATMYARWGNASHTLPTPTSTPTGKSFAGWYTQASGGTRVGGAGETYNVTANTTLYAQWSWLTYAVSYNSNGGSGTIANQTKTYGTNLTLSNGSGFTGPSTTITYDYTNGGAGSTSTTANRAIAGWNLNSASGTAYALSGTYSTNAAATMYARWGNASHTLPTPTSTPTGKSFSGWYTQASGGTRAGGAGGSYTVTSGTTLYAQWAWNTYTVSYNANGGSGSMENQTKTHGTNLTLRTNTFTGPSTTITYDYTNGGSGSASTTVNRAFSSFNTVANGSGASYSSGGTYTTEAAATMYAQWGNAAHTLPTPSSTPTGKHFTGWYTQASGGTRVGGAGDTYNVTAGTTLYAQWEYDTYTVSYNSNGGSGTMANQTKTYGTDLTLRTNTFTGPAVTVNFNANGGTVATSSKSENRPFSSFNTAAGGGGASYSSGGSYTTNAGATMYAQWGAQTVSGFPTPTWAGHTFLGWFTSDTGGTQETSHTFAASNSAASTTLYAHWSIDTYQITYDANGGSGTMSNSTKTHDVNLTLKASTFTGPLVTLTYDVNGGNALSPGTASQNRPFTSYNTAYDGSGYTYGDSSNLGAVTYSANSAATMYAQWGNVTFDNFPTPTRSGYKFNGWTYGGGTVTSLTTAADATITAQWLPNYTVTYSGNSSTGTVSGVPASQEKINGETLTLSSAVPDKYYTLTYVYNNGDSNSSVYKYATFDEWNTATDGSGTGYSPGASYGTDANLGLFAQWTDPTVGTLPSPSRAHYYLVGWYYDSLFASPANASDTLDDDKTLYAKWERISYTVSFNAGGGSGTMADLTKYEAIDETLPANGFTGPDAKVNFNVNGAGASVSPTYFSQNRPFAQWLDTLHSLTYADEDNFDKDYDTTLTAQWGSVTFSGFPTPVRAGYTFDGWYTAATGGTPVTTVTTSGEETVFAHWTANTYNVHYKDSSDSSTLAADTTFTFDSPAGNVTSAVPTKTGYTFGGWTLTQGGSAADYQSGAPYGSSIYTNPGDLTLWAVWNINSYNVVFNGNSTAANSQTIIGVPSTLSGVNYLSSGTISAAAPSTTGYVFEGWAFGSGASSADYSAGDTITMSNQVISHADGSNNITLYAVWTKDDYDLAYNANASSVGRSDGEVANMPSGNTTVEYLATGSISSNVPTLSGYTFAGWQIAGGSAVYDPGDSFTMTKAIVESYASGNVVNLNAVWTANSYNVHYKDNSDGSTLAADTTFTHGSATGNVTSTVPVKTGYTFGGWTLTRNSSTVDYSSGQAYGTSIYNSTSDVDLWSVWNIKSYNVLFDSNSAAANNQAIGNMPTALSGINYLSSGTVPGNTPSTQGYAFGGWSLTRNGSAAYSPGDTITMTNAVIANADGSNNITLYAIWTPLNYNVSYATNAASIGLTDADISNMPSSATTITYLGTGTLSSSVPTATGYTFTGWETSDSVNTYAASDSFTMSESMVSTYSGGTQTIPLRATWSANTYYIRYYDNNGQGAVLLPPTAFTYGSSSGSITAVEPVKSGATFLGWSKTLGGSTVDYSASDPIDSYIYNTAADVPLYAVWQTSYISVTVNNSVTDGMDATRSSSFAYTVTINDGNTDITTTYTINNGGTQTFNVQIGYIVTITQSDYSGEGFVTSYIPVIAGSSGSETVSRIYTRTVTASDSPIVVNFTNVRGTFAPTGLNGSYAPYICILTILSVPAIVGACRFGRRNEEEGGEAI